MTARLFPKSFDVGEETAQRQNVNPTGTVDLERKMNPRTTHVARGRWVVTL